MMTFFRGVLQSLHCVVNSIQAHIYRVKTYPFLSGISVWPMMPVVLVLLVTTLSSIAADNDSAQAQPLPSFSARHITWHEPSDSELHRVDIELAPHGLRVKQATVGKRHQEMLQDFESDEAWLIDHKRSIAHRLPLENTLEQSAAKPGDGASFLSQEPCGKLLAKSDAGKGKWRGRDVRAWHCEDGDGNIASIEFIDDIYHIVVYKRTANGWIDELRNLQDRTFSKEHFKPGKKLRLVDRQEFFFGTPSIPEYQEPD